MTSRRAQAAFALAGLTALVLASLGVPLRVEAAPPNDQYAVMSGWNVGAMPRICTNDGTGNWINCQNLPITDGQPDGTSGIDSGDFNEDGIVDLVIANQNGTLNTCLQSGTGTWTCQSNGATGRHRGAVVADFDGDGHEDLVGAIETMSNMDVCLGDGTGAFTCSRVAAPNGGREMSVADWDGDGDLDIAYAAWPGPSAICANDGTATFTCSALTGVVNNIGAGQGDFDSDGNLDAVFAGGGTADDHLCLGDGLGGFTCTVFNAGGYHSGIDVADLDNDGDDDLVMGGDGTATVSCLGDGLGGLTCAAIPSAAANIATLDLGFIDGDGTIDLILGAIGQNQTCLGDGLGGFACTTIDTPSWNSQGAVLVDPAGPPPPPDTDGDGVVDPSDNCPAVPNPAQTDTDGDTQGDACDTDDDNDTLTDVDETTVHLTDPLLADTDGDTLDDGAEVTIHLTDPLLADTDGDTLDDGAEVTIHLTDPLLVDTDGDGWNDDVELVNGSDPNLPPQPQGIVFPTPPDRTFDQGTFTVTPTAGSGLPVDLAVTGSCSSAGFAVTPTGAGTCTLTFTQPGDYSWLPAPPVVHPVAIDPGIQTITFTPPGTMTFGDPPATIVAAATSGLPVGLTTTGPCSTAGTLLTVTGAGTCTVFFDQAGNADWDPAVTQSADVTIGQAFQTITFTPPAALTFGDPGAELTAVATSALPVQFAATGPCTLVGATLVATGAGTCTITADQAGDLDWAPAPTVTGTVAVGASPQSITIPPIADRHLDEGAIDVVATATSGLPVELAVTGPCTIDGTTVTPTGAGPCTISADQPGAADWLAAPTATTTLTVLPGRQTIAVTPPTGLVFGDEPVELVAVASSGLPVRAVAQGVCRVDDLTLTIDGGGDCAVAFVQDGDDDWDSAPQERLDLVIGRAPQEIELLPLGGVDFGDPPRTVTATASSGLPVELRVFGDCALIGDRLRTTGAGSCSVTAGQPGDDDWAPAITVTTAFTVGKAAAALRVEGAVVGPSDEPQPVEVVTEPPGLTGVDVRYEGSLLPPIDPGDHLLEVTLDHPDYAAPPLVTTYTVLEPAVEVDPAYRLVSMGIDRIVADGLPTPAPAGMLLTITGLPPGTVVTISDTSGSVEATADETGIVALDLAPPFDLAEATLAVAATDGGTAVVSTEEVLRFGDSTLALEFEITEGDDVEQGTVVVTGAGLQPESLVEVHVHSTPILIGTVQTDASGAFTEELALPAELETGEHRVLLQGAGPEGSLTGTWFFAVEPGGAVERVGDPEVVVNEPVEPAPVAPVPASAERSVAQEPDPEVEAELELDDATGLPVYEPAEDPEQSVDSGVNGFALLTVVTAAGGSMAALSSMAGAASAGAASGGLAAGAAGGASAGTAGSSARAAARRGSGSGGSAGSSDDGGDRGKGKLASGKAKGLGDGGAGLAWGDASPTWRWPWVARIDGWSRVIPDRIRPVSPLLARVTADGSTLRAVLGTSALATPAVGFVLGLLSVAATDGQAVAPTVLLVAALVVLGVFDATAGLVGAATFATGVLASGGIESTDSLRTVMGIGSLWFAVPLIAGGVRKFRREVAPGWEGGVRRLADVAVGSLLGAWTVQTVLRALPGLAGLDLPIAEHADRIALVALAALIGRYLLETIAVRAYPERLAMVAPLEGREAGTAQQLASIAVKAGVFVFVILPYLGPVWQLWAVVGLSLVPQLLGIVKERFPNSGVLFRVLPKGVPNILLMIVVGKLLAETLAGRISDPVDLTLTSFVVLSIPGFLLGLAGLFGRDGDDLPIDLLGRIAGTLVVVATVLTVQGVFDGGLAWTAVVVAPALAWWMVTAWRADRGGDDVVEEDEPEDPAAEPRTLQPA